MFLAPEQLARPDRRRQLAQLRPSLVAVDEAHCVSWGHEFRPDYFRLGELIGDLGHPPVIALTATTARDQLTVLFEDAGYRTLDLGVVQDQRLLTG